MAEKKRKKQETDFITILRSGEESIIEDRKSGSKGIFPIKANAGYQIEVAKLDSGLIQNLNDGDIISDAILYTIPEKDGERITCLIELKGTGRDEKVSHAVDQIKKTISYIQNRSEYPHLEKYLKDRTYVMAAVAGAPDKTLPKAVGGKTKELCMELYKLSTKRKEIRTMESLLVYVAPNKKYKTCALTGQRPPYTICCHNAKGACAKIPSILQEALEQNMK